MQLDVVESCVLGWWEVDGDPSQLVRKSGWWRHPVLTWAVLVLQWEGSV